MNPSFRPVYCAGVALLLFLTTHANASTPVEANVGVAPAFHMLNGPFASDQTLHYGLRIDTFGVINKALIQKHKKRIPARFRKQVANLEEARVSPFWYIPSTLFISPDVNGSSLYGVAFKPFGLGAAIGSTPRLGLNLGVLLTYAYYQSDQWAEGKATHFLRPGAEARLDIEFPITKSFLLSLGWASQVYVPQEGGGFGVPEDVLNDSIWHIGQAYLMFHTRFEVDVNL